MTPDPPGIGLCRGSLLNPYAGGRVSVSKPYMGGAIDGAVQRGGFHAGCRVCSARIRGHFADDRLRRGSPSALRRPTMIEPIFGLIVAVGLGLYLLYTLLRPEKF